MDMCTVLPKVHFFLCLLKKPGARFVSGTLTACFVYLHATDAHRIMPTVRLTCRSSMPSVTGVLHTNE